MRRILCSNNVRDIGRLLENVVFLELMRREGDVYVGQSSGSEIDFVTNGPGGRRYYQVSESVHDSATLDREPSSLRAVRDNYPKTLITLAVERRPQETVDTRAASGLARHQLVRTADIALRRMN